MVAFFCCSLLLLMTGASCCYTVSSVKLDIASAGSSIKAVTYVCKGNCSPPVPLQADGGVPPM